MSPKELLYIEDALGHTQFLISQCRTAANQLTDPALRQQPSSWSTAIRNCSTIFIIWFKEART